MEVDGSKLSIDFLQELGYVHKDVSSDIHEPLSGCEFQLVVLADVVDQSQIYQCDNTVEYVVFERGSDDFVMGQDLVVVPLYGLTGSRCMVDYVSTVLLVESSRRHRVRIIFYSG